MRSRPPRRHPSRSRRLCLEPLEPRLALASVPIGTPEIVSINASPSGMVETPDVALADDGRYVISWTQREANGVAHVRLQAFDAYHRRVGDEIVIASNFGRSIDSARVAIAENGRFAVIYRWEESTVSPADKNVYVRVYDWGESDFLALERVNAARRDGGTASPDIAMADDGRFVITWEGVDDASDGDKWARVYFRSFTADGTPHQANDVQVFDSEYLDARQYRPSVAITNDGDRVAFAWEEQKNDIDFAVYEWDSANAEFDFKMVKFIAGSDHLRNTLPTIGIDDDHNIAIAYRDHASTNVPEDTSNYTSLEVWRFDGNGNRIDNCGTFCVPNDLDFISGLQPTSNAQVRRVGTIRDGLALAVDGDGSLAMTWSGQYPDLFDRPGEAEDVYFKEFIVRPARRPENYTEGTASGSTNNRWGRVNTTLAGDQWTPAIDKNDSGFVIAYVDRPTRTVQVRRYFDRTDFSGEHFDAIRAADNPSDQLTAGQSALIHFSVRNIAQPSRVFDGTRTVDMALPPPVTVAFYLSQDADITTSDKLLTTRTLTNDIYNALSNQAVAEVFLPRAGDPFWNGDGPYHLGMIVDPENLIFEEDETNNANRGELLDRNAVIVSGTTPAPPQFAYQLIADKSTAAPGGTDTYFGFLAPLVSNGVVSFLSGTSAGEGIFNYDLGTGAVSVIANVATPVPGGTGNFSGFSFYGNDFLSSDDSRVAFFGTGAGLVKGIFTNANGSLSLIANEDTDVPGGPGKFTDFVLPATAIDGARVVFGASDGDFRRGLYEWNGGTLSALVNGQTKLPGTEHTFDSLSNPSLDGNVLAFYGQSFSGNQEGIYLLDGSGLQVVADRSTMIPGQSTTFTNFHSPGDVILDQGSVAFLADDGVYLYADGQIQVIADHGTPIPNGVGNFTGFSGVSLHNGVVAFLGFGNNSQQGIYVSDNGTLIPVIAAGEELLGRTVSYFGLHNEGFDESGIGFVVNFTDGEQAVVYGRRLRPAVTLDAFRANGTDEVEIRYTIADGPFTPFDIDFYRSPVAAFDTSATRIDSITIDQPSDLTTGAHLKTFKIGGGANEISLPGAGLAATDGDHFLVAAAQQSSMAFSGIYHVAGGPIVLHGGSGAETIHVKIGSVQIEWNGQVLTFPDADVSSLYLHTHGGNDVIDLTAAGVSVSAFGGDGQDTLAAGATTAQLDGGAGDDTFHLGLATAISVGDPGGIDRLNFSTAQAGIDLDLDLQATAQNMSGGRQLTLQGLFEDLVGTAFSDTVRVDALSTAPRSVDLLTGSGGLGDRLHVDAGGSSAVMSGGTLIVNGYQPIELAQVPTLLYSALTTWRRPTMPLDVTNDGFIVPQDVLVIINELNNPTLLLAGNKLPDSRDPASTAPFYDANGDGFCTALDALQIINYLNQAAGSGEGSASVVAQVGVEAAAGDSWLGAGEGNRLPVGAIAWQVERLAPPGECVNHAVRLLVSAGNAEPVLFVPIVARTGVPSRTGTAPEPAPVEALEDLLDELGLDVALHGALPVAVR